MKRLLFNLNSPFFLSTILALLFLMNFSVFSDAAAINQNKGNNNEKIHISSDRLVSDSKTGLAEFTGKVKVRQGETLITSDSLKIFYDKKQKRKTPEADEESIKKLTFTGNVKIIMESRIAATQQAEYIIKEKVLILTGEGSKVISGNNSISGNRIILYRTDGRVIVERGSKSRVKAVFTPGSKEIY